MKRAAGFLLGILYPDGCRSCGGPPGASGRFFCRACEDGVERLSGPCCSVCGRPFSGGAGGDHPCPGCITRPPAYGRARAPVAFSGVIRDAVHLYKYRNVRAMRRYLGGFMEEGVSGWPGGVDMVAAVPLHQKRFRSRGFNQSLFLAERAAAALGAPLSLDGLVRTRHTRPQVRLSPGERRNNVRGAFSVSRPEEFEGRNVLLVDDVYTTGATVGECAGALRKAGASGVDVLTLARAV